MKLCKQSFYSLPLKQQTIAFLGSKEIGYSCLIYLILNKIQLNIEIKYVITNDRILKQDSPKIKNLCQSNNIKIIDSLKNMLDEEDVDFIISVQFHEILKKVHIDKAKRLAINLHMAPLPEYRGCNQFSFAIIDQISFFGTTIHKLEESIDGGDILFEDRFEIPQDISVFELYQLTYNHSIDLFQNAILKLLNNEFISISQNSLLRIRNSSFHHRKDINKIKKIDLQWDKEKINRYFRATYFPPFNPPYCISNGKKIDITPQWIKDNDF